MSTLWSRGNIPELSSLDTETIGGYAVILATESEVWDARSFEDCVTPIFKAINRGSISSRILMWNQGYDGRAILKYLPDENLHEILEDNTTVYADRYKILFIQGKLLKIRDLKLQKTFMGYDIAQFYNYGSLDDMGKTYIGKQKYNSIVTECITTDAHLSTDTELYRIFDYHSDEIKHYCREDARLTLELGLYSADTIEELFNFRPRTFAAKTVIGKELTRRAVGTRTNKKGKEVSAYPFYSPESAQGRLADAAYHGGIFDCMKRGTFGTCTDIDISSAYPYHMIDLPNLRNGKFVMVEAGDIEPTDKYGWIVAEFDYPLIPYTTHLDNGWLEIHEGEEFEVKARNKRKFYPEGRRWQPITLVEYRFLKDHGYLKNVGSGYVWRDDPTIHHYPAPFAWIADVYKLKQSIKKEFGKESYKYDLAKKPMNSAYGTTAQNKGYTEFRNLFYGSSITAMTRIQICEMLEEIGYDQYITIATDGILLEGDVDLPERYTQGGLGSWDVNKWDSALVLSNGIYRLEKEGVKPKQGLRGMLSYKSDLRADLRANGAQQYFSPTSKARPITMHQGMKWGRYIRDDINRFVVTERRLQCNSDTTKHWKEISNFNELLDGQYTGQRFTIDQVDSL